VRILLFQATRELLFNVAKHSGTAAAVVRVRADEGGVWVTVEDQGVGFDPAKLERPGRSARGFGLFSVRERVRMHGGRVELESEAGKGARVSIYVPFSATS
jgi:two-component system sensor histidine kinase UhpB